MRDAIHTAIIMDGNGRWATRRGQPRRAGHRAGAKAVDRVVRAAAEPGSGIGWLTLYAFSSDNWSRPAAEVGGLMRLFGEYLRREVPTCVENGVRLEVIGRRDRLAPGLVERIGAAESATAGGGRLTLRLAIDYSSRDQLVRAAALAAEGARGDGAGPAVPGWEGLDRAAFRGLLARAGGGSPAPDVDLLIRTGGERRLSDFLLWECAYAELVFTDTAWPDFGAGELAASLAEYRRRDRRFGRVLDEAV